MSDFYEREFWDTANRIDLFVACPKSLEEFTSSLNALLDPLAFENGALRIGTINVACAAVSRQPSAFEGLPTPRYTCLVSLVGSSAFGFWGALQWHIVVALAGAIRTKFSCHYLALLEDRGVLFYSGTNEPCLVNERWPAAEAYGALLGSKSVVRLNIPLAPEAAG